MAGRLMNSRSKPAARQRSTHETVYDIPLVADAAVSPSDCLTAPSGYRWPTQGAARDAALRALLALTRGRNCFIWGPPGAGKDALVHAFSALTRRPAVAVTFRPGADLAPWFYARRVDARGTSWEYGHLWRALTEGVQGEDGVPRPALVLLSDVDRADMAQLEWFRVLVDSIEGRILGPDGQMVPVLPGTQFVCTANTCGGGDLRGRLVSAQAMDASILDRLGRKIELPYLHWSDESAVLQARYAGLEAAVPGLFAALGRATEALRRAVRGEALHADFTHRSLCDVLDECADRADHAGEASLKLLAQSFSAWLEGLEPEVRLNAIRLIDPHLGGALELATKRR